MNDSPSLPSGLVTFMFTDIVGSTDLKGKMPGATSGERQTAFRDRVKVPHDSIITENVRAHGGVVIKSTGDGYFIAFSDAEKALLSALEIQRQVENAKIFTPAGELRIRIGLNSGQAEPIKNDYTASAADKAARVESKCQPGKVYLSRETHELIRGKVRGISTASVGSHDLKGVAKEELFVAFTEGSTATVPVEAQATPTGSTTIPNNLPRSQLFFGREPELQKIAESLTPDSRGWGALIDGPGGIGKTALAIRAAQLVPAGRFKRIIFLSSKERELTADGQRALGHFVLPSYLEMLNAIARELEQPDLAKSAEAERSDAILRSLRQADVLLVLDNLETLSEGDRDQLFAFLNRLPSGCSAIVTSRRRADATAIAVRLDKLDWPASRALLADIAKNNDHLANTTEPERRALYEETGGNPLLMRWVAGQLGLGRCKTIAAAVEFLRSAPAGNNPLEFIFGDLLDTFSDNETKVLASLTHFTSAMSAKFIAELASLNEAAAQGALSDLSSRALVLPDFEERNFVLVPMVADFLRKKKPEVVAETGNRLEEAAYALIVENGYTNHERFPKLDAAWPTVVPALSLFLAGENSRLHTVCNALQFFFEFTGRWDEWLSLSQQGEARAVAAGEGNNAGWRAKDAAYVYYLRQDGDAVLTWADRAAAHWEGVGAGTRERSIAIQSRGMGYLLKKDYPSAIKAFTEALELDRSVSAESSDVASSLNWLAIAEGRSRDLAAAERHYDESLRISKAVGSSEGVTVAIGNLARIALAQNKWPRAETLSNEALHFAEQLGRQELIASNSLRLAEALLHQASAAKALSHARRAVEIYTKLSSPDLSAAQTILVKCEQQLSTG